MCSPSFSQDWKLIRCCRLWCISYTAGVFFQWKKFPPEGNHFPEAISLRVGSLVALLSWLNPLLEGGLVQEGRVSLLLAGLLPYYALFLNFTFLLKASTFWHFGTVKVYSPNIFLSYIKKIWQIPTEIKSKKVKVKKIGCKAWFWKCSVCAGWLEPKRFE